MMDGLPAISSRISQAYPKKFKKEELKKRKSGMAAADPG
jgi:hypothetical protein